MKDKKGTYEIEARTREKRPVVTAEGYSISEERGRMLTKSLINEEMDDK